MSLQYIIDGFNIINHPQFTRRHKHSASPGVSLLTFIRANRLTGSPKNKVIIVFDGYPESGEYAGGAGQDSDFAVIFSRKISADEKIKKIVEESANRKNIVVVSDDREIGFMVKSLGACSIGVEKFIAQGEESGERRKKDSQPQELTYSQKHAIDKELRKLWLGDL